MRRFAMWWDALEDYVAVCAAAEYLGVSRQRIHQLVKGGILKSVLHGPKARLISKRSLLARKRVMDNFKKK